jgi:hypothetical protein
MVSQLERRGVRLSRTRAIPRRGMTVFVVLLVITMLGAVGVFAARSSQLGVSNAGRYREMTQTHYVAEAGMHATVSEFARDANQYLSQLRVTQSPSVVTGDIYPCQDIPFNGVVGFVPASTNCLRLGYNVVEKSAQTRSGNAGLRVFVPKNVAVGNVSLPGSFGTANIAGNFAVEITDERTVDPAPRGHAGGGHWPRHFARLQGRHCARDGAAHPDAGRRHAARPHQRRLQVLDQRRDDPRRGHRRPCRQVIVRLRALAPAPVGISGEKP